MTYDTVEKSREIKTKMQTDGADASNSKQNLKYRTKFNKNQINKEKTSRQNI